MTPADELDECGPNSFRPQTSSPPERSCGQRTNWTTPFRGVQLVRSSPGPGSSRFRDAAEAEFYQERAAVREYLGGVPRAAAERLAWLDVLAARQLAAGVLDHMADAQADPSAHFMTSKNQTVRPS